MHYYQQVLRENETLLFACRMHWVVFGRAIAFLLGALVLLILGASFMAGSFPRLVFIYAGYVCLIIAPLYGIAAYIRWRSTEIAVTDKRVIFKRGLIGRRSVEMNITKIETVDVDQGPLGRVLDYGEVVIRGTGGTFEPLRMVASPIALRNAILVG